MSDITPIPNDQQFAESLFANGYVHIDSSNYVEKQDIAEVVEFQGLSFLLPEDTYGGQRYRTHSRLVLKSNTIFNGETSEYSQTKEYNYNLGDVKREMEPIHEKILSMPFFQKTLFKDIELAKQVNLVDFEAPVRIGLHHVRYLPTFSTPSYSSPPWLHKDEEQIVFTHLVGSSHNIVGGDSVISTEDMEYTTVMSLQHAFDTLVVSNHKVMHAVTPIGLASGQVGYRDIFLVTFSPESEESVSGKKLMQLS